MSLQNPNLRIKLYHSQGVQARLRATGTLKLVFWTGYLSLSGRSYIWKLRLTQDLIVVGFYAYIAWPRQSLTLGRPSAHVKLPVSATKTQRWVMETQLVTYQLLTANPKLCFRFLVCIWGVLMAYWKLRKQKSSLHGNCHQADILMYVRSGKEGH